MADGWIELFDEAELLFVFDRFEPVDYSCGVFPLVEVAFFRDCAVDALEDCAPSNKSKFTKKSPALRIASWNVQ